MGDTRDEKKKVVDDPKRDHVIGYFWKHTHHKKYENYVVTGIWHRLRAKGLLLKPITQQYVRLSGGGYALIDLYFPAVNVPIECDESHHYNNDGSHTQEDVEREKDLEKVLGAMLPESAVPDIKRIDATLSLKDIDDRLDEVADEIAKLANGKEPEELWPEDVSAEELLRRNGKITFADRVFFKSHSDILNAFGFTTADGRPYKAWDDGKYPIDDKKALWFPNLIRQLGTARYGNVLNKENDEITEYETEGKKNDWEKIIEEDHYYRYTFCKIKDDLGKEGYRFYGKYRLKKELGITRTGGAKYIVWEKVKDWDKVSINDVRREAVPSKSGAARAPKQGSSAASGQTTAWSEFCRTLTANGWKERQNVLYRALDDCPYLSFKIFNANDKCGRLEFGVLSEFAERGQKQDYCSRVVKLVENWKNDIVDNVLTFRRNGEWKFGVGVDKARTYFVLKPTETKSNASIPFGEMEREISAFTERLQRSGIMESMKKSVGN